VLDYLERNIKSKPGSLAEVYVEEPEELDERYERVVAASLEAMARMLDLLLPAQLPEVSGRFTLGAKSYELFT